MCQKSEVQSCLGMVLDILKHFDYPTMLTHSDPFLKGTLPTRMKKMCHLVPVERDFVVG